MTTEIGTSETDVLKFLSELDRECDDYKDKYVSQNWKDIPDFYRGKSHWKDERPNHKVSPVLNFLRQAIERKTSQMTDTKPFIQILPYYDPLQRVATALEDIIASKWAEQSLDMVLTDAVFYSELFGGVGLNTTYNKELLHGKGDSTLEMIDPRNLNFDPACTNPHYVDRCEYVRIDNYKATSLLKYIYPDFADKIMPDAPFDFYTPERRNYDKRGRIIKKVIDRGNKIMGNNKSGAIGRSLIREYWIQDRTLESGKLKYPGGRHIIIAGGVRVIDEANPYNDKRFPVDFFDWHRNPDSAWGDSELADLKELQVLLNKLVAVIVENGIMMSNGMWVGDNNALKPDQWNKLDNVPGMKVKKKPGSELNRLPGTAVPPTVFSTMQYLEAAIEKLSGNQGGVAGGGVPSEVKSGIAIEALQQAALAIVRLKARALESLLERVGQKMISRIFQFEGGDRQMWRLKNDKDFEAFKYMSDMLKGETKEARQYLKSKADAHQNFLFKIRPGSSMQMNKWQESMLAMQLYQAQPKPLIDREAVLDMIDLPNRTEILGRVMNEEKRQEQNAIAMMAMQSKMSAKAGGHAPEESQTGNAPKQMATRSEHTDQGQRESLAKGQGITE
jgi:hypothetical protein